MKDQRRDHLLKNVSDKSWAMFKKQAKIRGGMELGPYFDILVGNQSYPHSKTRQ